MSLHVDERYRGAHGIGRYAREVLPRLRPEWRPLMLDGSPYSPLDSFRPLPRLQSRDLVYSPGYGALVRAPRQVLTMHDLIQLRLPWPGRAKFVAYYSGPVRRAVHKAGIVLTVSETSANDIRTWLGDDTVRVVNAGSGCSVSFVPDGPAAASADPYVLYVGNIRRHKNLDVLLRALALVPEGRLYAVLPRSEVSAAAARAMSLGVAERVDWLHGVADDRLAELYRGASATMMPSVDEGFGVPALESIACGVPVIFWRGCAAVGEIVGDRGWAMETPQDAEEWAAAMTLALSSCRRVAPPRGRFDWTRTANIVSDVLEQFLD
ncbi:MAG: glycosyltransferase family 1 protein [Microbacterium sp.]